MHRGCTGATGLGRLARAPSDFEVPKCTGGAPGSWARAGGRMGAHRKYGGYWATGTGGAFRKGDGMVAMSAPWSESLGPRCMGHKKAKGPETGQCDRGHRAK